MPEHNPPPDALTETLMLDLGQPLPLLPLRDTVVFPGSSTPVLLGREISVRAVEAARADQGFLVLVLQRDIDAEKVDAEGLYKVGVVARVQNQVYLPNGYSKCLVEGVITVDLLEVTDGQSWLQCLVKPKEIAVPNNEKAIAQAHQALASFKDFSAALGDVPQEFLQSLAHMENPLDAYFAMLPFVRTSLEIRQSFLEKESFNDLHKDFVALLAATKEAAGLKQRVEQEVRHRVQANQKEWLINEQIRLLQDELNGGEGINPDYALLKRRIQEKNLPEAIAEKVMEELERLQNLHQSSPEYAVVRNYIDWFLSLPFNETTQDTLNLKKAKAALDQRHFGLDKVKARILEHVAVLKLTHSEKRSPILCLVGPPGVGKTTLASAIADAMGRKFVRITLGGVRDEAEIRGHRRTYIGSMPGRFVQALRRARSMNPVILLDELDKMSSDFRGDPASAMLEVLDPEQNHEFTDHFLEVGIDLSHVLFIATANVEENIPAALRDRLEVVRLPGYYSHEKLAIAREHLIPKVCERNGIVLPEQLDLPDDSLMGVIRQYTREAGVRELEREIDKICRKRAMEIVAGRKAKPLVRVADLGKYLGVPPFRTNRLTKPGRPGVVTGLAWTSVGGEILQIECTLLSGRGRLILTGTMGDVMKESAQIALTLVRERVRRYGVDPEVFKRTDIHLHIPEGAIPKDGPSAGVAMSLAMLSASIRQAVPPEVAFTGEVSLTGALHAIGGLPEKALAALEAGVTTLYLPEENRRNAADLPAHVRKGLKIVPLEHLDEVIKILFTK